MDHSLQRPIQVYLDSSDFSVLSQPKRRTPDIVAVEEKLLRWNEQGLIQLRFSYQRKFKCSYDHYAANREFDTRLNRDGKGCKRIKNIKLYTTINAKGFEGLCS